MSVNHEAHQQILAALAAAVAKQRAQEVSVTAAAKSAESPTEEPLRTIVEIKVASLPIRLCLGLPCLPGDSARKSALYGSLTGSSRIVLISGNLLFIQAVIATSFIGIHIYPLPCTLYLPTSIRALTPVSLIFCCSCCVDTPVHIQSYPFLPHGILVM